MPTDEWAVICTVQCITGQMHIGPCVRGWVWALNMFMRFFLSTDAGTIAGPEGSITCCGMHTRIAVYGAMDTPSLCVQYYSRVSWHVACGGVVGLLCVGWCKGSRGPGPG